MTLDPRAKRFLDLIAASGSGGPPVVIQQRRHAFRLLMQHAGTPRIGAPGREITIRGAEETLLARLYSPNDEPIEHLLPGLVFFHGGGLVAGDLDTHDGICSVLASSARCRVVSVAYRLAPEHPFPAAVDDALASTEALLQTAVDHGIDPLRVAIGGDSVGANLAAVTCQEAAIRGGLPLVAQLLICPVLDATGQSESQRTFANGYFLDALTIAHDMALYGGSAGLDVHDPRVSPLRAVTVSGLPPAIIHTAEYDPVRDDGTAYARRLSDAGVRVWATCHLGMIHLFYGFGRAIPKGIAALETMGRELRAVLSS